MRTSGIYWAVVYSYSKDNRLVEINFLVWAANAYTKR